MSLSPFRAAHRRPIRLVRGCLVTASLSFIHPYTLHQVEVIGVVHLARQDYWDALGERLENLEDRGWAIHLEGMSPPTPQECLSVPADVTQHWRNLQRLTGLSGRVAAQTGLVHQRHGLTLPDAARTFDMTLPTVAARLDREEVATLADLADDLDLRLAADATDWLVLTASRRFGQNLTTALTRRNGLWSLLGTRRAPDPTVIVQTRNVFAVECAVNDPQPVVLVWGAAHLPGMTRLLRGRGYFLSEPSWSPAVTAADITLQRRSADVETDPQPVAEQGLRLDPLPWAKGGFRASGPSSPTHTSEPWRFAPRPGYDPARYDLPA